MKYGFKFAFMDFLKTVQQTISFYVYFFSVFFYVCESTFYVFFFFYRLASFLLFKN